MKEKVSIKENSILPIIGAIIGALIGIIPIILIYMKIENINILSLVTIVPILEFYIYKLFNGKVNRKLSTKLLIITITTAVLGAFIIIPIQLILKAKLDINFNSIKSIYLNKNIYLRVIEDCIILLMFSLLGMYIINNIIKRKILLNVTDINLFSRDIKEKHEFKEKSINILKKYFEKNDAMQKENSVSKEVIIKDIKNIDKIESYWEYLKELKIINKNKKEYYYEEKNESNIKSFVGINKIIIAIILTIIVTIFMNLGFGSVINRKFNEVNTNILKFKINANWNLLKEDIEKNQWEYYKYTEVENISRENYHSPEIIKISYNRYEKQKLKSINELKETLEKYMKEFLNYNDYSINIFETSKKYEVLELIMKQEKNTEICYYVYKDGRMVYITAITENKDDEIINKLKHDAKEVVNSFEWKK